MPPKFNALASGVADSDKYVQRLLRDAEQSPPVTFSNWYKQVRWFNLSVIAVTPLVALYGATTTHLDIRTFCFCVFYYVFNMIGQSFPARFWNISLASWTPQGITAGVFFDV